MRAEGPEDIRWTQIGTCSVPGKGLLSAIPEKLKCMFRIRLLRKGWLNVAGCLGVKCLYLGQLPWTTLAVSRHPEDQAQLSSS